jgi:hypothetical protein
MAEPTEFPDLSPLIASLATAGQQSKDNPLYQTIYLLIRKLVTSQRITKENFDILIPDDGSFTPGSVIFVDGDGSLTEDNSNFFFDDTSNQLRVTGSVRTPIVVGGTGINDDLILRATSGAGSSTARVFIQTGNNGSINAVEVTGDGFGRVGIGTVGAITVDSPLVIRGIGADIGYIAKLVAALGAGSAYIQMISAPANSSAQAGFSFSQQQNNVEWRMAVVGNEGNDMRWASGSGGGTINMYVKNVDGNILLNNARTWPTSGTKSFFWGDGTAPSGLSGQNIAGIFANDVGGIVELFAINEADEVTQLTGISQSIARTFALMGA